MKPQPDKIDQNIAKDIKFDPNTAQKAFNKISQIEKNIEKEKKSDKLMDEKWKTIEQQDDQKIKQQEIN